MSKFNFGDKVRIKQFGHMAFNKANCQGCSGSDGQWTDVMPNLVGKEGIVTKATPLDGLFLYSLSGVEEKKEFYDEIQLELI